MAFESKMFIVMMAEIVSNAKTLEDVHAALGRMAVIEGIKIAPFNGEAKEKKDEEEK